MEETIDDATGAALKAIQCLESADRGGSAGFTRVAAGDLGDDRPTSANGACWGDFDNDGLGDAWPKYLDYTFDIVFDQTEKMTAVLKEFLQRHIEPAAVEVDQYRIAAVEQEGECLRRWRPPLPAIADPPNPRRQHR